MQNLLTQDEIDAMVRAARSGGEAGPAREPDIEKPGSFESQNSAMKASPPLP